METIKFNINSRIRFKVTDRGHTIMANELFHLKPDNEGYYEAQLWVVMNAFGNSLYNGSKPPIETEIILLPE